MTDVKDVKFEIFDLTIDDKPCEHFLEEVLCCCGHLWFAAYPSNEHRPAAFECSECGNFAAQPIMRGLVN